MTNMRKLLLLSLLILSIKNCVAGNTNSTVSFYKEYPVPPVLDGDGEHRASFIDTLYLLNRSQLNSSDGGTLLTESEAEELALKALHTKYPHLTKNNIWGVVPTPIVADFANNVIYYRVIYDNPSVLSIASKKSRIPPLGKNPEFYTAYMLLDGSLWMPEIVTMEETKRKFHTTCRYSNLNNQWERFDCTDHSTP